MKKKYLIKKGLAIVLCVVMILAGLNIQPLEVKAEDVLWADIKVDGITYKPTSWENDNYTVEVKSHESIYEPDFPNVSGAVTIPDTVEGNGHIYRVTAIGHNAFDCNANITSVAIGTNVTSIGEQAFLHCSGLTSVKLPMGLVSMGSEAFAYSGITSITIPNAVQSMGASCFIECKMLQNVTYDANSNLKELQSSCFWGCDALNSINLPEGLERICFAAFAECTGITQDVTIPNSVNTIEQYAFYGIATNSSDNIKVIVNNATTSIVDDAFEDAKTDVYLPLTITQPTSGGTISVASSEKDDISSKEFVKCGDNVSITATPEEGYFLSDISVKNSSDGDVTVNSDNTFTMPLSGATVTVTFTEEATLPIVASVYTPSTGNTVNYSSMSDAITALNDGDTVTLLMDASLDDSWTVNNNITLNLNGKKLTTGSKWITVATDKTLTVEDSGSNGSITGDEECIIVMNRGYLNIYGGSFTTSDTYITPIHNAGYTTIYDGSLTGTDYGISNSGKLCVNGGSLTGGVNSVDNTGDFIANGGMFRGEIGHTEAFGGTISISGGLFSAKGDDSWLADGYIWEKNTDYRTSRDYPHTVKRSFTQGNLTYIVQTTDTVCVKASSTGISGAVEIPGTVTIDGATYTVTTIADNGFQDCTNLTAVTFAVDSRLIDIGRYAFANCSSLTQIVIPDGVVDIGDQAFNNSGLTAVTIPGSIGILGIAKLAFRCSELTSVIIPCDFDMSAFQTSPTGIKPDINNTNTFTIEPFGTTGTFTFVHNYGIDWKTDSANHWHECFCGDKTDEAAHNFTWIIDKEATYTEAGSKHEECTVCGYAKEAVEISKLEEPETPTEPENPVEPTPPVEPEKPTDPTPPVEPEKPTEPTTPAEPETPTVPETPAAPGEEFTGKEPVEEDLIKPVKAGKNYNKISWNKVKGADGYYIFAAKCNTRSKKYSLKLVKNVTSGKTTSFTHQGLKKATWYKYRVVAYKIVDGKRETIARSFVMHSVTRGGKYVNPSSVKVNKSKVTLKKGKTFMVKAKVIVPKGKKTKWHTDRIHFVSSNAKIAAVSSKGKIKAKKKGSCSIYAIAQNGVSKKIKVTVK